MSFRPSPDTETVAEGAAPPGLAGTFEEIVRTYARLVRSAVASVGGRRVTDLAEDVEQRVFLQLWRQVENEQEIRHPSSYIYTAAVRETVRLLKRELKLEETHEDVRMSPGTAPEGPDTALEASQLRDRIAQALATLAPRRRRAVRAHLAGYDVNEIMGLYGWSYNQARNLIARGTADLRRALTERGVHG
jgi:RNA polymerase sigma factor (sigma-70 family)